MGKDRETWERFDKIDYLKNFAPGIKLSHLLLEFALLKYKIKGTILDIGGGPGITPKILRKHKNNSFVYNVEPAKNSLSYKGKNYKAINMPLKKAIEKNLLPKKVDCIVACSALHELALSNKKTNSKNKKIMFGELNFVLRTLKKGGFFIVCEVEYKKEATDRQIKRHIWIAEHTIGHDHLREELLSIRELKKGLKGLKLIETRRKLQTHRYKTHVSKIIWSKLAIFVKN